MSCLEVNMDKSKIIRYIVLIISAVTAISTGIPCQKITTEYADRSTVEYASLMPSIIGGVIILFIIGNIILALSSKYKYTIWTSLGSSAFIVIHLFLVLSSVGTVHHEANKYDKLYEELGAQNLEVTYDVVTRTYLGFYILAGCAVLIVATGFICFMVGSLRTTEDD